MTIRQPSTAADVINAFSIDVEEYYHALIFQLGAGRAFPWRQHSRVEPSVQRILELLALSSVRATFFTLGEVAAAHPAMIRKIVGDGHEIACHGDRHELVSRQTPAEFRADVRRSKAMLEGLTGQEVLGYRAPTYSIGRAESWAYDVLLEEGFRYESSIYPIHHDLYGDPCAPRFPYEIRRQATDPLIEFPIGTIRFGGINLPIGGGGYFRLLPAGWFIRAIRRVNAVEGRPLMFYVHPWELDPGQPRPPMPWRHRFRHYVGMGRVEARLARLLQSVRFGRARDVLGI